MKIIFLLILFLGIFNRIVAQSNETVMTYENMEKRAKNTIYTNAEYYLIGGSVNMNYERFILSTPKFDLSVRGSFGKWNAALFNVENGKIYKLTGNMLFFKGNNHLELDLGASLLTNDEDAGVQRILPDFFIGYTYKKPDGHLVFKSGLGFLGFVSVGVGYAF